MTSTEKPNSQIILNAYVFAVQQNYDKYKRAQISYLKDTWIGQDGQFCASGLEFHNKEVKDAKKKFEESLDRLNKYKMELEDNNVGKEI